MKNNRTTKINPAQQQLKSEQKPGEKPMETKTLKVSNLSKNQRVGYAMRGARKVMRSSGYSC